MQKSKLFLNTQRQKMYFTLYGPAPHKHLIYNPETGIIASSMKKKIHPKYSSNVKVTCSCGNTFVTGSTNDEITTELCSQCHPFYTGEQKIVDSANLVSKFKKRKKKAAKKVLSKKEKQLRRKRKRRKKTQSTDKKEKTLKDMLNNLSSS
jgi:large subunit ribosomal protein L31